MELPDQHAGHWRHLHERLAECDRQIAAQARADARCVRVQHLTGIAPLTADAVMASVGNAREFKHGRQMAAWPGLVPSQHSSGNETVLGPISGTGDRYLRTLLIQGGRSSLQRAQAVTPEHATPEQRWIVELSRRLPFGKIVVAIANKHARQLRAMLAREEDYDAHAWLKHPMVQRPRSQRAAPSR